MKHNLNATMIDLYDMHHPSEPSHLMTKRAIEEHRQKRRKPVNIPASSIE